MFKLWKPHYTTAMDESKAAFDIAKILDTLDEEGREKVLAWLEVHYPNESGNEVVASFDSL